MRQMKKKNDEAAMKEKPPHKKMKKKKIKTPKVKMKQVVERLQRRGSC